MLNYIPCTYTFFAQIFNFRLQIQLECILHVSCKETQTEVEKMINRNGRANTKDLRWSWSGVEEKCLPNQGKGWK